MTKKRRSSNLDPAKDSAERSLLSHNDVFADLANVAIFGARRLVRAEDLRDYAVDSFYVANGRFRAQRRDQAKLWTRDGEPTALICFEIQTRVDPNMSARCFGYDGANARGQIVERSGLLIPVITVVVYANAGAWTKNRTLFERFKFAEDCEAELKAACPDYKLNVLELGLLTDEELSRFQSEFYSIAEYFVCKRRKKRYVPKRIEIKHPDEFFTIMMLLTGDKRFAEYYGQDEEEPKTMDKFLDFLIRDDVEKGVREGVKKEMRARTRELREKAEQAAAKAEQAASKAEQAAAKAEQAAAKAEQAAAKAEQAAAKAEQAASKAEQAESKVGRAATVLHRMGMSDDLISRELGVDLAQVAAWLAPSK